MKSEKKTASRKYDKNTHYSGKWVLYKKSRWNDYETYTSIFVISEADGIMRYVTENNPESVVYEDSEVFESMAYFFVNPVQNEVPEIAKPKDGRSYGSSGKGVVMDEFVELPNGGIGGGYRGKPFDPEKDLIYCREKHDGCDGRHIWSYSDLLSYPPIHTRKCVKCGREEYIPRESSNPDGWIEGRGY